jgi:hypothetical protein
MIVDFEIFNTLKEWNSRIEANKPACIKRVETGIDFVESDKEGDEDNVLNAVIQIYLETEDQYAFIDWMADAESYKDEKSKKEAVHNLLTNLDKFLKEDIDNGDAESFWEYIDLKKKQWELESDENNIWKVITEHNEKLIEEMKEKNPAFNGLATKLGLEQPGE